MELEFKDADIHHLLENLKKLTKFGLSCLIPIVEKVEALKGRILWSSRAHTYMTLMEDAEKMLSEDNKMNQS